MAFQKPGTSVRCTGQTNAANTSDSFAAGETRGLWLPVDKMRSSNTLSPGPAPKLQSKSWGQNSPARKTRRQFLAANYLTFVEVLFRGRGSYFKMDVRKHPCIGYTFLARFYLFSFLKNYGPHWLAGTNFSPVSLTILYNPSHYPFPQPPEAPKLDSMINKYCCCHH